MRHHGYVTVSATAASNQQIPCLRFVKHLGCHPRRFKSGKLSPSVTPVLDENKYSMVSLPCHFSTQTYLLRVEQHRNSPRDPTPSFSFPIVGTIGLERNKVSCPKTILAFVATVVCTTDGRKRVDSCTRYGLRCKSCGRRHFLLLCCSAASSCGTIQFQYFPCLFPTIYGRTPLRGYTYRVGVLNVASLEHGEHKEYTHRIGHPITGIAIPLRGDVEFCFIQNEYKSRFQTKNNAIVHMSQATTHHST